MQNEAAFSVAVQQCRQDVEASPADCYPRETGRQAGSAIDATVIAAIEHAMGGRRFKLYVAGSFARGDAGTSSDVDLFVLLSEWPPPLELMALAGVSPAVSKKYQALRIGMSTTSRKVSLRVFSQEALAAILEERKLVIWRDSPTWKSTSLPEVRATKTGHICVHPWTEASSDGGYIREIATRCCHSELVVTTETSMLLFGRQIAGSREADSLYQLRSLYGVASSRRKDAGASNVGFLEDPRLFVGDLSGTE